MYNIDDCCKTITIKSVNPSLSFPEAECTRDAKMNYHCIQKQKIKVQSNDGTVTTTEFDLTAAIFDGKWSLQYWKNGAIASLGSPIMATSSKKAEICPDIGQWIIPGWKPEQHATVECLAPGKLKFKV